MPSVTADYERAQRYPRPSASDRPSAGSPTLREPAIRTFASHGLGWRLGALGEAAFGVLAWRRDRGRSHEQGQRGGSEQ